MRITAILTAAVGIFFLVGASGQTSVTHQTNLLATYNRTLDVQSVALVAIGKRKQDRCTSAEKAIKFYRLKVWGYQDALKIARSPTRYPERRPSACSYKRFVVTSWRGQAREYRRQYAHYIYHYAWWTWLPSKWQRIGACETGYGKRPGRWNWNSGTFQGAFGFYWGTWDQYKPSGAPQEAYNATPRQQYQAALNVYAAHGYGAWGCGGA